MNLLEHTLIILLLLVGLLNSRVLKGVWWWIVGIILLLAFVSPVYPISLPWDWIAGIAIPLLFWYAANSLINSRLQEETKVADFVLWGLMALVITLMLWKAGGFPIVAALLFSLLISSIVWRAAEDERKPSYLGQIGPLMLAYLLAEIAPLVEAPDRYHIALIGGAVLGSLTGFIAVHISDRLPAGWKRNFFSIGQGYFAYVIGLLTGFSGVAASITSIVVYVAYGARRGLWETGVVQPLPMNNRPLFAAAVAALAFFAWQTHIPLTPNLLLDLFLGLGIVVAAIWIGRLVHTTTFREDRSFINIVVRAGFLLAPTLLLWPRQILLEPEPLLIAFVAAVATTYAAHIGLTPLLNLYQTLNEAKIQTKGGAYRFNALLVKDLMVTDAQKTTPDTKVQVLIDLFVEGNECIPVVDKENQPVGMVTEEELFLKETRIPRSGLTYTALFCEQVFPEELAEVYVEKSKKVVAADIMVEVVPWVLPENRVSEAIQMMVNLNRKCLVVTSKNPKFGGKFLGLITRSQIIRFISEEKILDSQPAGPINSESRQRS